MMKKVIRAAGELKMLPLPQYFETSATTPHTFFTKMVEHAKKFVPDEHSRFLGFLSVAMDDILDFVNDKKAVEVPLNLPLRISDVAEVESKWVEDSRDGLWKFPGDIYVGCLHYYYLQYSDMYCARHTFVFAPSEPAAIDFLDDYSRTKWLRNREGQCVLDYNGTRLREFRKMAWEDIFMPDDMVNSIRNEMETFFKSKDNYAKHGLEWKRGIMLAGRPGNGKTALCQAIAGTCPAPVIYCMLDDEDMFQILESLRHTIKDNAPCCVIIEDADTLGGDVAVRSALLNLLDGLFTTPGVLTIASTNSPEKLDEAFTGRPSRFDSFHVIKDPGVPERIKILKRKLGKVGKLSNTEYNRLASEMEGLSAAFVQEVAACALLESFRTGGPLSFGTLEKSLNKVKEHIKQSERTGSDGIKQANKGPLGF